MILPDPVVEAHGKILVVRDDLLPGGTKMRAIMPIIMQSEADEFVYASPAQGYAQVALAHCARHAGRKATIFTAMRNIPHPLTLEAKKAGAMVVQIAHGRLNVVTARSRAYAKDVGAMLIPFGCDDQACINGISEAAKKIKPPHEVWTVAGSGVLTRALQAAWPKAKFFAVIVGKRNINTGMAKQIICNLKFEEDTNILPPFPSASNYDAKAWAYIQEMASDGALFWNVAA